uniref:Protein MAIN-LIKE 2-like n=1 Tax=Cicer arietinum TaxID=3827 RepID=A0A1S2Z7A2_CICAR|nr:protein MAIN-LIKE 2-like [Cicer arietinum]
MDATLKKVHSTVSRRRRQFIMEDDDLKEHTHISIPEEDYTRRIKQYPISLSMKRIRHYTRSVNRGSNATQGVSSGDQEEEDDPRVPRMRGAFGQIIRNIIGGDRGDGVERIPPTASNRRRNEANRPIRQRRRRQDIHDDVVESTAHAHMEEDVLETQIEEDMEHADDAGFPGGPMLRHVLTQYEHHVARRLWEGEDCGPLKVITHGLKLKKFSEVLVPHPVEHWIRESGLLPLSSTYLIMVDAGLISAFVERWHRETNSFHLPFREMTITLDDVATLLHISPMFECAARTYLLHLVGSTIFADKTHTRVEAKYISLFIDLDRCRYYSWAAATLVFLYDNMGDEAVHDTRQLGGYMALLQCWIYEHFPRICKRGDRGAVPAHLPRACRWIAKHAVEGGLVTYRQRLDGLLLEDVVFTPYDDDRANHPFEDISMFSGYLRCGGVSVPYLPERCLRQFGRIQCIPPDDYYPWYMSVSHPLIIPRSTAHAGTSSDHPSYHPSSAAHVDTSSAAHAGPSSFDRDCRAAELVRRAINLVEPFSEIHEILSELSLLYDD